MVGMRTKLAILALILVSATSFARPSHRETTTERYHEMPQQGADGRIPLMVSISAADSAIDQDSDAKRFRQEFLDQLKASNTFYWWGSAAELLPKHGLHILLVSVQAKNKDGEIVGSAIVLSTSRPCAEDPSAEHLVQIKAQFLHHNEPVDDVVRAYFDELKYRVN
jgi:hypothetical protein